MPLNSLKSFPVLLLKVSVISLPLDSPSRFPDVILCQYRLNCACSHSPTQHLECPHSHKTVHQTLLLNYLGCCTISSRAYFPSFVADVAISAVFNYCYRLYLFNILFSLKAFHRSTTKVLNSIVVVALTMGDDVDCIQYNQIKFIENTTEPSFFQQLELYQVP